MTDDGQKCSLCIHAAVMDTGYSNWTVLDTVGTCIPGHHPKQEWEVGYFQHEPDADDRFAEHCPFYEAGGPGLSADVDLEDVAIHTPEARTWWTERGEA